MSQRKRDKDIFKSTLKPKKKIAFLVYSETHTPLRNMHIYIYTQKCTSIYTHKWENDIDINYGIE